MVSVGNPSAKDLDIDMIFGVNALHFLIATSSVLYALENAWPFIDCFTVFLTVRNHRSRIRSSNEGRQFRSPSLFSDLWGYTENVKKFHKSRTRCPGLVRLYAWHFVVFFNTGLSQTLECLCVILRVVLR